MPADGGKPPLLTPYPGRARTQPGADRRDVYTPKTPPAGVPLAIQWEQDVTSKYEGPELDEARAKRPTEIRVGILERKNDELLAKLLEMSATTFNTNIAIVKESAEDTIAARKARRELVAKTVLYVLGIIGAMLAGKAL